MDSASGALKGHHRVLFHDPVSVAVLAAFKSLVDGKGNVADNVRAGLLHLLLDKFVSAGKRKTTRDRKQKRGKKRG
jgi:hypothetical protein